MPEVGPLLSLPSNPKSWFFLAKLRRSLFFEDVQVGPQDTALALIKKWGNMLSQSLQSGLPKGPWLLSKMKVIPREISPVVFAGECEYLLWCSLIGIAAEINALTQVWERRTILFRSQLHHYVSQALWVKMLSQSRISSFQNASILFCLMQEASLSCLSNAQ